MAIRQSRGLGVHLEALVRRPPDFGDGESESGSNWGPWEGRRRGRRPQDSGGPGKGGRSANALRIRPRCESWVYTGPQAALAVAETSFELHEVEGVWLGVKVLRFSGCRRRLVGSQRNQRVNGPFFAPPKQSALFTPGTMRSNRQGWHRTWGPILRVLRSHLRPHQSAPVPPRFPRLRGECP